MKPRRTSSQKRSIRVATDPSTSAAIAEIANRIRYGGNPEHKRNPGDFGLQPPSAPRPAKTLCDAAAVTTRSEALRLLKEGVRRGLISEQHRNGWPQNIWAVADNGVPLEAMLENRETGTYHGYPLQWNDPIRDEVLIRWG